MKKKIAYIMRGIPGSGKSTVAALLQGGTGIICSTDRYFYILGRYNFDAKKLEENHARNLDRFRAAILDGLSPVICDNTNIKKAHYEQYVRAAEESGYEVVIITMPVPTLADARHRNIHDVPKRTIMRMINEFEE